ncbi:hypothetical protein TBC1_11894 [Lentimicrobium saccharophilum]|uniref:Uncharacterized protein n=1 Tax=Lentimicrobium saccharophilum TaxID=1678841 RepID=A0A0S7C1U6_9BACT|nr:hypothetical protein [Lentimicrobium saccharophilum]GAP42755.1 hypothetical protein TBC1_11894 [Lentimicrobium saccharophilum]
MHDIEPFYAWRNLYDAADDIHSPFYGRTYSETQCINSVYNYFIHPLWDEMGSATLYIKILYADYRAGFCVIECLGEWNDTLYNDIMYLYRNVAEILMDAGIRKFILIGENVLNFHADDDSYYQEWFDGIEDGWIACINFRDHVLDEIHRGRLDYYLAIGGKLDHINWRTLNPKQLFTLIDSLIMKRLTA